MTEADKLRFAAAIDHWLGFGGQTYHKKKEHLGYFSKGGWGYETLRELQVALTSSQESNDTP